MQASKRIGHVDAWRCIAVMLVILSHSWVNPGVNKIVSQFGFALVFEYGSLGVYIFFFISGFVVSKTCLAEVAHTGNFSRAGFYTRRVFRIIPPLLLYLTTCTVLAQVKLIEFDGWRFIASALYLCNLNFVHCGWYADHTWSLAFEEQFYLLFPVFFLWYETSRRPSWWLLLLLLFIAILPFFFPLRQVGRTGFFTVYALFMIGFYAAKNEARLLAINRLNFLFVLAALLTFFPPILIGNDAAYSYYKFIYIFSIPLMILSSGHKTFFLKKVFSSRILIYGGKISYSIYLWQQLLFGDPLRDLSVPYVLLGLLGLVLWCITSFEFFEKPLVNAGRRLSARQALWRGNGEILAGNRPLASKGIK